MDHDEYIRLIKENAGLKTGYEKYKRKYKLIRNILMKHLWARIEALDCQYSLYRTILRNEKTSKEQCAQYEALLNQISKQKEALQAIYEMCREVDSV